MARLDKYNERTCWIDTFDRDTFLGTIHRIFGPVDMTDFQASSLIVGPEAHLKLTVKRDGNEKTVSLEPNALVPDLPAILKGARIIGASIEPVMKVKTMPATARRRQPRSQSVHRRQ